jgi:hypothetical protein
MNFQQGNKLWIDKCGGSGISFRAPTANIPLAVIPPFYVIWRGFQLRRTLTDGPPVAQELIRESVS